MKRALIILGTFAPTVAMCDAPNVIFILIDDLGKEWVDYYGSEEVTLPNINSLVEQSVTFDNAYSTPQSTPSRVSLMTGQYPYNNGWVSSYDVPQWGHGANFDPAMNPCLPQQIKERGYATCAAGKWQLNDFRLQPDIMNTLGYDSYCMWTSIEGGNEASISQYWNPSIHMDGVSKVYEGEFGPDIYNSYVLDFLRENHDKPFYVYYPMALTHKPLVATPHHLDARSEYEMYTAMVQYADFLIGRLLDEVDALGIADNTYIILTSDNGSSWAYIGRREGRYIRGGKSYLSENGINVPLMVRGPGIEAGKSNALVDFTDIYPTIMDMIGAKREVDKRVDGASFLPVLQSESKGSRKWALSMGGLPGSIGEDLMVRNVFAFRDRVIIGEEYKIYITIDRTIDRIYAIEEDPYEERNLIDDPQIVKLVTKKFAKVIAQLPEEDANPKYTKLKGSLFDMPYEKLQRSTKAPLNFRSIETQEEYQRFLSK